MGNESGRSAKFVASIKEGRSAALITDSGTPGISDPGYRLVHDAIGEGIRVEAIPGPSAMLAALVASGAPMDEFVFLGFPPPKGAKRADRLRQLVTLEKTAILYESPHRLKKLLAELLEIIGNRSIMICRELTKKFEEIKREPLEELIRHFDTHQPRGEFVVVVPKQEKRHAQAQ